jgi:hypothetical protein
MRFWIWMLLAGALACALNVGCGSPSGGGSATASADDVAHGVRVSYVIPPQGQRMTLIGGDDEDRAELYSRTMELNDAGTKITTTEVLDATVEFLHENGFEQYARTGAAPANAGSLGYRVFEIERNGKPRHWLVGRSSSDEERKQFRNCELNFTAVYNQVYQLQAVKERPDWEAQDRALMEKPKKKN